MTFVRTSVVGLLLFSVASAAELTTLEGKKLTGDIVAVTATELTFKATTGEEKMLVTTINAIVVGPAPKAVETGKKHTVVELVDGSVFRCESIAVKGDLIELKLLTIASPTARTVTVPRTAVFSINREAGNAKFEQDFRKLVRGRGKFDLFVTRATTTTPDGKKVEFLDAIAGTFGSGDAEAGRIDFTREGTARAIKVRMTEIAGMIFNQRTGQMPPAICKVVDVDGNEFVARSVGRKAKGYTVATVTDIKADFEENQVSKFDFAAGSVKYLSDLDPFALVESGTNPERYQRDTNLDRRPIRLLVDPALGKTETYPKGITVHAKTEITYELKAQYKTFRALIGVDMDPDNEGHSVVRITIDDGTAVIFRGTVKKGDKPVDLNLSVQNVDKLKITVESNGTPTDLHNQVSFANARVVK